MGARPQGSIKSNRFKSLRGRLAWLRDCLRPRRWQQWWTQGLGPRLHHWWDYQTDNRWMPTSHQSHLHLTTDLQELPSLLQWFDVILKRAIPESLPPQFLWECQLILTEGFTNAARHAHHHRPPHTPIVVEVGRCGRCLNIQIWDYGDPFDWDAKLALLKQEKRNPLEKESGRGLMFMEQLSRRVRYRRYGKRNCLMVQKSFPN